MLRWWPALFVAAVGMLVLVIAIGLFAPDPGHSAFASNTGNNYAGGLAVLGTCAALLVTGWKTYVWIDKPRTNR